MKNVERLSFIVSVISLIVTLLLGGFAGYQAYRIAEDSNKLTKSIDAKSDKKEINIRESNANLMVRELREDVSELNRLVESGNISGVEFSAELDTINDRCLDILTETNYFDDKELNSIRSLVTTIKKNINDYKFERGTNKSTENVTRDVANYRGGAKQKGNILNDLLDPLNKYVSELEVKSIKK